LTDAMVVNASPLLMSMIVRPRMDGASAFLSARQSMMNVESPVAPNGDWSTVTEDPPGMAAVGAENAADTVLTATVIS